MEEVWKDIEGYEGLYQVSNSGRVKSFPKKTFSKERILKNIKNVDGYNVVDLCKNGQIKIYRVCRLVAQAFIANPDNKPCVGHKDESTYNDCSSNLEWVTHKENNNMPLRLQRLSKASKGKKKPSISGRNHPRAKTVVCDGRVFETISECEKFYGLSKDNIARWLRGERNMPQKFIELGLRYANTIDNSEK